MLKICGSLRVVIVIIGSNVLCSVCLNRICCVGSFLVLVVLIKFWVKILIIVVCIYCEIRLVLNSDRIVIGRIICLI